MNTKPILYFSLAAALALLFGNLIFEARATEVATAGEPGTAGSESKVIAFNFSSWSNLDQKQARLAREFPAPETGARGLASLPPVLVPKVPVSDWSNAWRDWSTNFDGLAAAFLGITKSLSVTHLLLVDGSERPAIDLVKRIKGLRGDRLFAELDCDLFLDWNRAGARFRMSLNGNKVETGQFNFNTGDVGGSLHQGYDIQGYTSLRKVPRLQINYRLQDCEADIDIDGYAPYKFGFIPNPFHLTYENSDVRYWFESFTKKFGDPGFSVKKVQASRYGL